MKPAAIDHRSLRRFFSDFLPCRFRARPDQKVAEHHTASNVLLLRIVWIRKAMASHETLGLQRPEAQSIPGPLGGGARPRGPRFAIRSWIEQHRGVECLCACEIFFILVVNCRKSCSDLLRILACTHHCAHRHFLPTVRLPYRYVSVRFGPRPSKPRSVSKIDKTLVEKQCPGRASLAAWCGGWRMHPSPRGGGRGAKPWLKTHLPRLESTSLEFWRKFRVMSPT
jgi:hypothetical protein